MSKPRQPDPEIVADLHGQFLKAGCTVSFHAQNQWNVRKNDKLVMWFPFSKNHTGCCNDADQWWQSDVTPGRVLKWLGADLPLVELQGAVTLSGPFVATTADDPAARRFAILNKQIQNIMERLVNIEERLAPPA